MVDVGELDKENAMWSTTIKNQNIGNTTANVVKKFLLIHIILQPRPWHRESLEAQWWVPVTSHS